MQHPLTHPCALLSALAVLGPALASAHALPEYVVQDPAWRLWPNGVVYYELESRPTRKEAPWQSERLPVDAATRRAVQEAMELLQKKTAGNVVFISSNDQPARLKISMMPWDPDQNLCGQASVGYQSGEILQIVDNPSCKTRGVALHELMHSLGFLHENQRYQALMDVERRPAAQEFYADKSDVLDHDSITYNDGLSGERLDRLGSATDTLIVRLRYGLESTGRWFQELSTADVQTLLRYYNSEHTIQGKLSREQRIHPQRQYVQIALQDGNCMQMGARKSVKAGDLIDGRELFAPRCDADLSGQRWAFDADGSVHHLDDPGSCLSVRAALQPHQIVRGRTDSSGGYAVLEACGTNLASQRWLRNGSQLINQAYPHLFLSFAPAQQNMLAWPSHPDLRTHWSMRQETPTSRSQLVAQSRLSAADVPAPGQTDPWSLKIIPWRDDRQHDMVLKNRGRCLSAEPGYQTLQDKDEHFARMRPCDGSAAQRWTLQNGLLASIRFPGHCLANTGLYQPTDDQQPGFAGLQRCNAARRTQQWTLKNIDGAHLTLITARVNPFVKDHFRVLEVRDDGLVQFGYPAGDKTRITWQVERSRAAAPLPAIRETGMRPEREDQAEGTQEGEQIVLLGGNRAQSTRHCLAALGDAGGNFASGEKQLGVRRCDSSATAQRWTLQASGVMRNAAYPALCLGQNKNRIGMSALYSYPQRGLQSTGFAVLQHCETQAPSQRWQWRKTRFHHQNDAKSGGTGDQLMLRDNPKLSLLFNANTQDPPLSIGKPDVANNFMHYRWSHRNGASTTLLAPRAHGAFRLDWITPAGAEAWRRPGPGYIGKNVNMRFDRKWRALRWHSSRQCLTAPAHPGQALVIEDCRSSEASQQWRITDDFKLINLRHASLCVGQRNDKSVLLDCADASARAHWYLNDSNQLESLDYAPLALRRAHDLREVVFDEKDISTGPDHRWQWIE